MFQIKARITDFINHNRWGCVALGIGIAGVCYAAQPVYHQFKSWRANQLLERSHELYQDQAYLLAFYKAHTAALLDNSNIEANRNLASLANEYRHPQASSFWETVLSNPQAGPEDWMHAVDASLQNKDLKAAFTYLQRWERVGIDDKAAFTLRRVQALLLARNYPLALSEIRESLADGVTDPKLVQLYFIAIDRAIDPQQAEVLAQEILQKKNPILDELLWVSRSSNLASSTRVAAILELLNRTQEDLKSQIVLLDQAAKLDWPEARKRAISLEKKLDPADEKALELFTSLLCQVGEYAKVLELLGSDVSTGSNVTIRRNYLIAQIEQGQTSEVLNQTAENYQTGLSTLAEDSLLRALAFKQDSDTNRYQHNLSESIENASSGDLAFLEEQLKRLNESDALLKLYRKVSSDPKYSAQASILWLRFAESLKSEDEMKDALAAAPDNWLAEIEDERVKADCTYWNLVYGNQIEDSIKAAEGLAATYTFNKDYHYLLAFSYLSMGQRELAKFYLPQEELPTTPRNRLIAAAINQGPLDNPSEFLESELNWLN